MHRVAWGVVVGYMPHLGLAFAGRRVGGNGQCPPPAPKNVRVLREALVVLLGLLPALLVCC